MITIGVEGRSVFWSDPVKIQASANGVTVACGLKVIDVGSQIVIMFQLLSLAVFFIQIHCHSPRMTNTGPGERRTTWQPSVLATRGG